MVVGVCVPSNLAKVEGCSGSGGCSELETSRRLALTLLLAKIPTQRALLVVNSPAPTPPPPGRESLGKLLGKTTLLRTSDVTGLE